MIQTTNSYVTPAFTFIGPNFTTVTSPVINCTILWGDIYSSQANFHIRYHGDIVLINVHCLASSNRNPIKLAAAQFPTRSQSVYLSDSCLQLGTVGNRLNSQVQENERRTSTSEAVTTSRVSCVVCTV